MNWPSFFAGAFFGMLLAVYLIVGTVAGALGYFDEKDETKKKPELKVVK